MNDHTMRPFPEFIRELAQAAAAAPDAEIQAINGARALLPGEVFQFAQARSAPKLQRRLEAAVVHRTTIRNDELVWDRGMEEIGPYLLALVGYAPEGRKLALRQERDALKNLQPFTELEWHLIRLLGSAERIDKINRDVLARQLVEQFQGQRDFKAERWSPDESPASELRIKGGSAVVAVMLDTAADELAAVELRIHRPDKVNNWRLPPSLGSELMPRIKELIR